VSLPVILRPGAENDARTIYSELESITIGLGRRFYFQLRASLERIESMPEMYGTIWKDVRAVRVRKFRYIVYYVVFVDRVEVIAIMHGSRDESAWRARV